MAEIDFSLLRIEVKEAAQRAFETVRANHPNEQFYGFALYSDDSAMTIMPAANSEEALLRKAQEEGYLPIPSWLRWSTSEWSYEAEGDEYFNAAYDMINAEEQYDEMESGSFELFREKVFLTMVQALGDLDATGFFGKGETRKAVTLFCSISDSEDAENLENESACQLNPTDVYEKFTANQSDND
jgi:Domain of unknown function (DUF4303)